MTPEELCKELGGYADANKLRIEYNGKPEYIGSLIDNKAFELNELGLKLLAEREASIAVGVAEKPKIKASAKVKTKARKVISRKKSKDDL